MKSNHLINTPWGMADHHEAIAVGVDSYDTPGHGGYKVSAAVRKSWPAPLRDFVPFNGHIGWYEEDEDFAIVWLAMADLFDKLHGGNVKKVYGDPRIFPSDVAEAVAKHNHDREPEDSYSAKWKPVYRWVVANRLKKEPK